MQIIRDKLAHNITGDKQLGSFWGYADSSRRLPLAGYNPALRNSTWAEAFLPAAVYPASDKIIIKHNLETGTPLTLSSTGTLPAPLEAGTNYYVIKISDVCIKLAASSADATAGTAIDLTDTGSGIHTLQLEIPAGFGTGTQSDPYRIRTASDLLAMQPIGYGETYDGCDADTYWELLADIDMDDPMFAGEDDTGWAPIGRIAYWWQWTPDYEYEYEWFIKPFAGHFDGNGHAIKNMRIYRDNNWWDGYDPSTADDPLLISKYMGFFGAVGGNAVIQNLVIEDPDVYVRFGEFGGIGESEREAEGYPMYTAGCFAGTITGNATITNCGVKKTIASVFSSAQARRQGGFAGRVLMSAHINHCEAEADSTGNGNGDGGFVGTIGYENFGSAARITNCIARGNITNTASSGGFASRNYNSKIANCIAMGNVTKPAGINWGGNGGFISDNYYSGRIVNCYSTGSVTGYNFVGGFAANNILGGKIYNSYSTGSVTGTNMFAGGFVGAADNTNSVISNCYSLGTVNGYAYVGGFVGINDNQSTIKRCLAAGNVSSSYAGLAGCGGFFGLNERAYIHDCYAAGNATGPGALGGFGGMVNAGFLGAETDWARLYNCYCTGAINTTIADWQPSTAIANTELRKPTTTNHNGIVYRAYRGGTTGATEPDWVTDDYVYDNDITWEPFKMVGGFVGGYSNGQRPGLNFCVASGNCFFDPDGAGVWGYDDFRGKPKTIAEMLDPRTYIAQFESAAVNTATDAIEVSHFYRGYGAIAVTFEPENVNSVLPEPMLEDTIYYVKVIDETHIQIAPSAYDVIFGDVIDLTSQGAGLITIRAWDAENTWQQPIRARGFLPDDVADSVISIDSEARTGSLIRFETTGTLPTGLAEDTDYYAIEEEPFKIKVAASLENAIAGTAITLEDSGSGIHYLIAHKTFMPYDVSASDDTIKTKCNIETGTRIRFYEVASSTLPGGLSEDTDYYAIRVNDYTIKAATSFANAIAGTAINLTTAGDGLNYFNTYPMIRAGYRNITNPPRDITLSLYENDFGVTNPAGGSPEEYNYVKAEYVKIEALPNQNCEFVNWTGSAVNEGKVDDPEEETIRVLMDADYGLTPNFLGPCPPTPDPARWLVPPTRDDDEVTMSAQIAEFRASCGGPVEYRFTCTGGSGESSDWQESNTHTSEVSAHGTWIVEVRDGAGHTGTASEEWNTEWSDTMKKLTITAAEGGRIITPEGGGEVWAGYGEKVDIEAQSNTGWRFVNWTGTGQGEVWDPNSSVTKINMNDHYTITANFEPYG